MEPSNTSSFLGLPVELRYMVYSYLGGTGQRISKDSTGLSVHVHHGPTLPQQLVCRQVHDEYIDCIAPLMKLELGMDDFEVWASQATGVLGGRGIIFCDNFPRRFLPKIRHVEIWCSWTWRNKLSTIRWLHDHSVEELESQARMAWTPSKDICATVRRVVSEIELWCTGNAELTFNLNLENPPVCCGGKQDYVLHEPTFTVLQQSAMEWHDRVNLVVIYGRCQPRFRTEKEMAYNDPHGMRLVFPDLWDLLT
jgi:hypothetical protein